MNISRIEQDGRALSLARLTLGQLLIALVAVGAIVVALLMLFGAERGLTISHTEVDGIPVTVFAPRDEPPAPSVLIGHGFAGSRQLMHPFAVTLARNGYVAVTFDFPGHGRNRTPLAGTIGEPERAEALLDAFARVARYARTRPGSDGRLATLGHSMAGDILVRYADDDPEVDASVAVSPYLSRELGEGGPRNLLFVYGEYEPAMIVEQGREALAAVADAPPTDVELAVTYGDMGDGSARRLIVADGVEHIGVLYSATSLNAALDWLNQTYGRDSSGVVDARGPWLGLFYLGAVLLAWPLSRLLPRVALEPLGANLRWRRLLPLAIAPALLTPLILWPLPSDFLPIVIGDYIALHFGLYGLLT
ncbi:MAG: alpha/beta fold hydrolase, partial [Thiohalocapsa sp.]